MSGLGAFSMWDLFRSEVETQMRTLTDGLLALERGDPPKEHLAAAMRAAHSIKGAGRIVQLDIAVTLSHTMEDCLVAAQDGALTLQPAAIDVLLSAGDVLSQLSRVEEAAVPAWVEEHQAEIDGLVKTLGEIKAGKTPPRAVSRIPTASEQQPVSPAAPAASPVPSATETPRPEKAAPSGPADRTLKVGAQTLNRLMGLAGESLVQSRWFEPFSSSLLRLKRRQSDISEALERLEMQLNGHATPDILASLHAARHGVEETRRIVSDRQIALESFGLRSSSLTDRLYREVVSTRMRAFGDGIEGFPRLVRDLARQLGKEVQIDISGRHTEVDREILDRLEAPLNHAIRNSVDHGIEMPDVRVAKGKPPLGTIRVDARHRAGLFVLTVSDDGRGVDIERLRRKVLDRGLATPDLAAKFSDAELLEFLWLPGFSTAEQVTSISGRGVGLDAVQEMAKAVGGVARISSPAGQGLSIQLELPLTLSVVRTFVAEIGGEPFAFPVTRIARAVKVNRSDLSLLEGQHYFSVDGERVGVVSAREVLGVEGTPSWGDEISVILLGDRSARYGLAVDKFLGEYDMVVRPLDVRLGKVADVSAASLMEDGSPVLILDLEDLTRSVETALQGGRLRGLGKSDSVLARRKRILVVDDSITVREAERSLLRNRGYDVEVAVDGMDGWNALRAGHYDLTVTDVDMPRMTGIELVTKIKADPKLHALPVIIVSYKDREEDRMRGLDAGADRYMTKSSFHDETLVSAVAELIGPPQ
jgi:two-component system, chemotaxis family, sensor histidine kinase and response regulator WspE